MAQLKFYKQSTAPASATEGAIWFDTTNHTIQVKVASGWDKYAGALNDATWSANTLTITKHDGSSIALNFSDMASAAAMKSIFTDKFGLNADMSYTGVYATGNTVRADIVAAKAATDTVGELTTASDVAGDTVFAKINTLNEQIKAITGDDENGDATTIAGLAVKVAGNTEGIEAINKKIGGSYTEQNTVASAIEGVSGRVETIETLLNEDSNDTIDNLRDVIDYFNGVKETETGAALLTTVAGHTTTIGNLKSAAFTESSDYATAAQGSNADTALANAATAQGRADDAYALAETKRTEAQVNDAISAAISALDSDATSADGSYVTVKVTLVDGKVTTVNVDDTAVKTYVDNSISSALGWVEFE